MEIIVKIQVTSIETSSLRMFGRLGNFEDLTLLSNLENHLLPLDLDNLVISDTIAAFVLPEELRDASETPRWERAFYLENSGEDFLLQLVDHRALAMGAGRTRSEMLYVNLQASQLRSLPEEFSVLESTGRVFRLPSFIHVRQNCISKVADFLKREIPTGKILSAVLCNKTSTADDLSVLEVDPLLSLDYDNTKSIRLSLKLQELRLVDLELTDMTLLSNINRAPQLQQLSVSDSTCKSRKVPTTVQSQFTSTSRGRGAAFRGSINSNTLPLHEQVFDEKDTSHSLCDSSQFYDSCSSIEIESSIVAAALPPKSMHGENTSSVGKRLLRHELKKAVRCNSRQLLSLSRDQLSDRLAKLNLDELRCIIIEYSVQEIRRAALTLLEEKLLHQSSASASATPATVKCNVPLDDSQELSVTKSAEIPKLVPPSHYLDTARKDVALDHRNMDINVVEVFLPSYTPSNVVGNSRAARSRVGKKQQWKPFTIGSGESNYSGGSSESSERSPWKPLPPKENYCQICQKSGHLTGIGCDLVDQQYAVCLNY